MLGDLTTLAQVKQYLGETGTSTDALLASLVSACSKYVTTYLSRNLFQTTYAETRDGRGGYVIRTMQFPIVSVASVYVNGIQIPLAPNSTSFGFLYGDTSIYLNGYCFSTGFRNVLLNYTAGIATQPGSPPIPTNVPADIAQAVVEMVAVKYKRRKNIDVRGETLAQQTLTYAPSDITPAVQRVLDQYKRTFPIV